MPTGAASLPGSRAEQRRQGVPAPETPGMRRQEALVVTAAAAPEGGQDGEQPRQPAGLGCRARGEPGGPQEPRKQCEFSFSRSLRGRGGGRGEPVRDLKIWAGMIGATVPTKAEVMAL
jgi:hypothetical protein